MTHSFSPADPSPGQTGTAWPRVPTLHYPTPGTPCPPFPSPSFPGPSCSLSLSPRAADGQQPEVPLWGLPKGPEQMGSATGSPPANEGSQERAVGILSLLGVQPTPRQGTGAGTHSQTRSTGQSFLTSFPRLALEEKTQGCEVEGWGGSGGESRLWSLGLGARWTAKARAENQAPSLTPRGMN